MTRIKISKEERYELGTYIIEIKKDNMTLTNDSMTIVRENREAIHFEELMISLIKYLY